MNLWHVVVGIVLGLVVAWLLVVIVLWLAAPDARSLGAAVRLLPDLLRLVAGLARDRRVPRRARWIVVALIVYLASPIDVIPDFIPVLGFADDVVVALLALRIVLRVAPAGVIADHWHGSEEALSAVYRLAGHPIEVTPPTP